jgi:hypothetical protein
MAARGDREYGAYLEKASKGNTIDSSRSAAKEAEALAVPGITKSYIESRGGLNSQGYYNDVPAYQQLTANERASVTLSNGHINSMAMLAILNQKEAEYRSSQGLRDFSPGSSTTSSGYLVATPPAPTIMPAIVSEPTPPVKTAPIDTILFDDAAVPIEIMSDLIFENIGGQELISIVRSDIVNGQKVSYQPIKNLSSIQQQYNPNNILGLQQTADRFFAGFSIKLEDKIPEIGNGINGKNAYFDETNGDLIIEFINLNDDEQVEISITASGTIYEANLGDYIE